MRTIKLQLPGMRKADECVVYPRNNGEPIVIQGARSIARFDPVTGEGIVNFKGSNPKYFVHLMGAGAQRFTFDQAFIRQCQEIVPNSGDEIGAGVYIA